MRQWRLV